MAPRKLLLIPLLAAGVGLPRADAAPRPVAQTSAKVRIVEAVEQRPSLSGTAARARSGRLEGRLPASGHTAPPAETPADIVCNFVRRTEHFGPLKLPGIPTYVTAEVTYEYAPLQGYYPPEVCYRVLAFSTSRYSGQRIYTLDDARIADGNGSIWDADSVGGCNPLPHRAAFGRNQFASDARVHTRVIYSSGSGCSRLDTIDAIQYVWTPG